ncbi:MAG TPA: hypothetical protein VM118_11645 [Acidobacteriota bacterium]|nr:hypothetical protein [Acidobacteriota bacterium]
MKQGRHFGEHFRELLAHRIMLRVPGLFDPRERTHPSIEFTILFRECAEPRRDFTEAMWRDPLTSIFRIAEAAGRGGRARGRRTIASAGSP